MTPDTVHFIAQIIRHHRGLFTAVDKWVQKQPPGTCRELKRVIAESRRAMTEIETELGRVDVNETVYQ